MAGLESLDMAYPRYRPSRSISVEQPPQLPNNYLDSEISRQHRETLIEISRNRGNFDFIYAYGYR